MNDVDALRLQAFRLQAKADAIEAAAIIQAIPRLEAIVEELRELHRSVSYPIPEELAKAAQGFHVIDECLGRLISAAVTIKMRVRHEPDAEIGEAA